MEGLSNVAELSNVCSVATVVFCFVCMLVYIIRVQTEGREVRMDSQMGLGIPAQMMKDVKNPFKLVLHPDRTSSVNDGVWLQLTSRVKCQMQLLWGVNISAMYPAIYEPWDSFIQAVETNEFLENSCIKRGEMTMYDPSNNAELHYPTGDGNAIELGERPRAVYPLVIVLTVPVNEIQWDNKDIVGIVTIVHLNDEVCPGKSDIISQYVRTTDGQPHNLQQLYVTSSDDGVEDDVTESAEGNISNHSPTNRRNSENLSAHADDTVGNYENAGVEADSVEESEDIACGSMNEEGNQEYSCCIVCQCDQVTVALLPCRHTCVCRYCLLRLDKCPMCRSGIQAYFTLDKEQNSPEGYQPQVDRDDNPGNSPRWWVNLNQRINNFLGFS